MSNNILYLLWQAFFKKKPIRVQKIQQDFLPDSRLEQSLGTYILERRWQAAAGNNIDMYKCIYNYIYTHIVINKTI